MSAAVMELPKKTAQEDQHDFVGRHMVASYVGCKPNTLSDLDGIRQAMAEAEGLCSRADLLLCVGSSLEVYPVAGLPGLALDAGGRIAIVTQSSTPYDGGPSETTFTPSGARARTKNALLAA